ncbi:MAG: CoA-transferase [Thermodesulfobacteriota bacterium]
MDKTSRNKVMSLPEAVAELVRPGDKVAVGCGLEGFIPFAASHEIIRQGIGPLTLIAPISNICLDQIIAAGLAQGVIAAWVGNVSTGVGYAFRRAVEEGRPRPLTVFNHSNFSLTLALEAGSRGLPMAVSRTPLGSDIIRDSPHFQPFTCPHSGQRLLAVKALNPEVALIHVQLADAAGNGQGWGASGFTRQAALAARRVLLTCEELVDSEVIRADPDRTLVPGLLVDAVCPAPWGAHPSSVQGYYNLDNDFFVDYSRRSKDPEEAQAWLKEWILETPDRRAYLAKLDPARLARLEVSHPAPSSPVEYGW